MELLCGVVILLEWVEVVVFVVDLVVLLWVYYEVVVVEFVFGF